MKFVYLSSPLSDLSPKKLSCFSSQGRLDFLQLMIESQNSTSHSNNKENHSNKGNNIQIFTTGRRALKVRGRWGDLSQRKAQWGHHPSTRTKGNPPGPSPGCRTAADIYTQEIICLLYQITFPRQVEWLWMCYQKITTTNLPQPHSWLPTSSLLETISQHQFCSSPLVLSPHSPDWHRTPGTSNHLYFCWLRAHQQHTFLPGIWTCPASWCAAKTAGGNRHCSTQQGKGTLSDGEDLLTLLSSLFSQDNKKSLAPKHPHPVMFQHLQDTCTQKQLSPIVILAVETFQATPLHKPICHTLHPCTSGCGFPGISITQGWKMKPMIQFLSCIFIL